MKRRSGWVYLQVVLDRRDKSGAVIGQHELSGVLRRQAIAEGRLREARELYPAARLQDVA
jgi:hypothetical protein